MKFVDQVRIQLKAGDGGHGAVAFRREKYIDKGGPSGGDGGNGGSIIFVADSQLTTLLDFRYQQHHNAKNGQHGLGSDCNGKNGEDLVVKVPLGTLVFDHDTNELLIDLSTDGQTWVAAKGGKGGLGNMNFTTSTRQAPRFAQDGRPGEEKTLVLELKLLADVGLIGFPNAGKSTFVSRVSRARPKIADYPFTTLVPNLGVVAYKDRLSFVIADIPGLIEGASEGHGLGHQFLRHVERCRVLIHLVDLSPTEEGRVALKDYDAINLELEKYSGLLADKPQIVVANKLDLPDARAALPAFVAAMKKRHIDVLPLSGATGEGLQAVLDACAKILFSKSPPKPAMRSNAPVLLSNKVKARAREAGIDLEKPARPEAPSKPATKKSKPKEAAPKVSARKPVPSRLKAKGELKRGARGRKR